MSTARIPDGTPLGLVVRCNAERAGIGGCHAPVTWRIKAASTQMYACGRHLNRVCLAMVRTGVSFMTISIE